MDHVLFIIRMTILNKDRRALLEVERTMKRGTQPGAQITRGYRLPLILISLLALLCLGMGGTVLSLSASGGGGYGDTITISVTVRADDRANNSNLYFEIRAPDGSVVDTHSTDVPRLEAGETFSHSWTSNNSSYPLMGDYTVSVCWSPGNSRNCQIAQATTGFYSVWTLGPLLTGVGLLLLGRWIWSRRHDLRAEEGTAP